jgi:hypothetical protein
MSLRKKILIGIGLVVLVGGAIAGNAFLDSQSAGLTAAELNAAPQVGEAAPAFTVVDTRGRTHSLEANRGQWVVLEWFNHGCPYSKKHYKSVDGRPGNTQAMQEEYTRRGVTWLSVVSSAPGKQGYGSASEADEEMRDRGAAQTAVIRDTAGVLGRLYAARNTPQYAIIDPQGVLRYAGAIDDNASSSVKTIATARNYVRAALDAGLAGNEIAVTQTQPYGCDVKY